MDFELKGKAAVVSGSTAGIGFAIATALAAEGASVVINGRTEARVTAALEQIRTAVEGAELTGVAADLEPQRASRPFSTRCRRPISWSTTSASSK